MFKVITGKEALKLVADGEEVHFRSKVSDSLEWVELEKSSLRNWNISEFIYGSTGYIFAIKTEPMRKVFHWGTVPDVVPGDKYELHLDVAEFAGKAIAITVEEIEQ